MHVFDVILFSQYSFERLAPAVLTFVIFVFLLLRKKNHKAHRHFTFYFGFAFLYEAGHLITYSLYTPAGAYGWFLVACAPFALVSLIQFAYCFQGEPFPREARIVFWITLGISMLIFGEYVFNACAGKIIFSETGYAPQYISKLIPGTVLVFFCWTVLVFFRKVWIGQEQSESIPAHRRVFSRLFFPHDAASQTLRDFGLLVVLDILKTAVVALHVFFRAIPYVTLISFLNVFFLVVYSLYVIYYIKNNVESLSLRFKIVGTVLVVNLLVFDILGYVSLAQFEDSYDSNKTIELKYMAPAIASRDVSAFPDDVDYVVKITGSRYDWLFVRDAGFPKPSQFEVYDFTPGRWRFSNSEQHVRPENAVLKKRYFAQISNADYNQYVISVNGERYAVGYNYHIYRKEANVPALHLVVLMLLFAALILFILPVLLKAGFMKSIDTMLELVKNENTDQPVRKVDGDELAYMAQSLRELKESVASQKKVEQENAELKQKLDKKEEYSVSIEGEEKIKKAIEYLEKNYMYDIAREGLAEAMGMSPGRFGRAFLNCTGKKISDYINELRVQKAAELLAESDMSVIDIAYSAGFESLSTFSRAFNKSKHVSPKVYREQFKPRTKG